MDQTISAIDTIALRIPLYIWAPVPMSQKVPRTHVESLYVRVTTSGGVVGWGESFGTARPMVIAAFDNWIRRFAVGQSLLGEEPIPHLPRGKGKRFSARADVCRFRRYSVLQDRAYNQWRSGSPAAPGSRR